jgi:hypothetical protein
MRRRAVLLTLAALEAGALALLALFWFAMRPDLVKTYGTAEVVPWTTEVALSRPFTAVLAGVGAVLTALSFVPRWRTRTRTSLAATALVWTVFGLAFAIWAAYAPAFAALELK